MKLWEKLDNISTPRNILGALFLQTIIQLVLLVWFLPQLRGEELAFTTLDMRVSYTQNEVLEYFQSLGKNGRKTYLLNEVVDYIFGAVYLLSFALLLSAFSKQVFQTLTVRKIICILPLLMFLFDYAENTLVVTMILGYPGAMIVAPVSSLFTGLKQLFLGLTIITVMILGLGVLKKKLLS